MFKAPVRAISLGQVDCKNYKIIYSYYVQFKMLQVNFSLWEGVALEILYNSYQVVQRIKQIILYLVTTVIAQGSCMYRPSPSWQQSMKTLLRKQSS